MSIFSKRLKGLREEYNEVASVKLTGAKLGEAVGVSKQSVSKWENGLAYPDFETLKKLADFFNVSTDYLLGKTDIKNPEKESNKQEIPDDFETPEEAMRFVLEQNVIMGFGGFDVYKMSDEEVVEFANELLNQLRILSYKYKK